MTSVFQVYRTLLADKRFFRLFLPVAIPIALQNLVSSLTSLGSGLLVGQLGDSAIAGVSLAGQVQFVMILASFGIGSGAAIFTSQYWGRSNSEGVGKISLVERAGKDTPWAGKMQQLEGRRRL